MQECPQVHNIDTKKGNVPITYCAVARSCCHTFCVVTITSQSAHNMYRTNIPAILSAASGGITPTTGKQALPIVTEGEKIGDEMYDKVRWK